MPKQNQRRNLSESLRSGDLKDYVSEIFSVDRYTSKMGEDKDIIVLGFRVKEKNPAADLMEFIEKGYSFILDADMSTGEENDGQYQVFAEIQRTPDFKTQLKELLNGIGQLCDCYDWRFRYQKSPSSVEFNEETVMENIPMTGDEYQNKMLEIKNDDVRDFFDQGSAEVALESNNTLIFSKPYSGPIAAKFIAIGEYDTVKELVPGRISLDESSQSQCLFLTKYLGNYEINKIGNRFLICNGDRGMIIEKDRW
jgi:SepF-like predicted cell division protein (DUF552 family)